MIYITRVFKKALKAHKFNKFIRFSIIGGFGFIVDILIFFLAIQLFGVSVYLSKLCSAFFAACFTWYLNRLITFSMQARDDIWREWLNYIYAMIPGTIINYLVFCLIVYSMGDDTVILFFAISIGVISGLIINFNLAKLLVFKNNYH
jgi:putative flippase GtrA